MTSEARAGSARSAAAAATSASPRITLRLDSREELLIPLPRRRDDQVARRQAIELLAAVVIRCELTLELVELVHLLPQRLPPLGLAGAWKRQQLAERPDKRVLANDRLRRDVLQA